ncbi:STAS domain-containing protein [Roseovarius sp.]|jgi:anti-sigma B factor antagonist|uniref:STAS domain-containing protein n=1 Tax=Roseovarius sp. TaxID=1486281 RepID=UPI002605FDAD|nr:STAS domain-containing protein [Roseovarius sp.]MDM8167277.1 STAS domain-containing protein [Roseovarius sp.]
MELDSSSLNGVQVISVMADRIDSAGAIRFKDAVRAVVDEDAPRVVLDLGRVGFVDSSGLGAIVAVMKFLGPERKLDLAALTPNVDKVFRLTRMDTVFGIYGDVDSATRRAAG